jgi:transcription antitermination protein NusB
LGRRRGARKLALDVLYQHELTGTPVAEILNRYRSNPAYEFAETVVSGVVEHRDELDGLISSHAEDWSIERMPVLDRNLLRMALFEMLHLEDVPSAVAINEAVELAKIYSTEDSSRFINGILGTVAAGS